MQLQQFLHKRAEYKFLVVLLCVISARESGEEPMDWSYAVLELLREQGYMKEMNDRYLFDRYCFSLL